jgi:hypothetical protein
MRGCVRRMVFALGLTLVLAGQGFAGPIISVPGLQGLGSFDGTFTYTAGDTQHALIQITLHNTSPVGNGGYLTAFAFNNPFDRITSASLTSSNANFGLLGSPSFQNGISAPPFGKFDLGASTSSKFLGGGNPSSGIGVGDSASFNFLLKGNHLDTLTEQDFFNTLSNSAEGEGPRAFVARFRGFKNGGSDKVPGKLSTEPPISITSATAPEPTSLALAGTGLLCLGASWWRRKRRG